MSWEDVFPGSYYAMMYSGSSSPISTDDLNFFISSCNFIHLDPNGAVRITPINDDVKTFVTSNKFESCSSGEQKGGSLYSSNKGQIVQTKNSYIKSNSKEGTSFFTFVSDIANYKNQANETSVFDCGNSIQESRVTTHMRKGLIIMNQCNITQNKVTKDTGGYQTQEASSDSYITCVNVIDNKQGSIYFNYHSNLNFKITSCNYVRNNGGDSLIYSLRSDLYMNYCYIQNNQIHDVFGFDWGSLTFENSRTDSTSAYGEDPKYINTGISFETGCPPIIISITPNRMKGNKYIILSRLNKLQIILLIKYKLS